MNHQRPTMETECKSCGKTFHGVRSKVLKGLVTCCSKECRGAVARAAQKNAGKKPTHGGCVGGKLSPLYARWAGIKARCHQKSHPRFKEYGGRGIVMCGDWIASFAVFEGWAKKAGFREDLQIDRINNALGYSPENCRWVTPSENSRNRIKSPRLSDTEPLDMADIELGITRAAFRARIKSGLPLSIAASLPKVKNGGDRRNFKKKHKIGKYQESPQ